MESNRNWKEMAKVAIFYTIVSIATIFVLGSILSIVFAVIGFIIHIVLIVVAVFLVWYFYKTFNNRHKQ